MNHCWSRLPFGSRLLVALLLLLPASAAGQWRSTLEHYLGNISGVYFLDRYGHPEIGFVGTTTLDTPRYSTGVFKTTDFGQTWRRLGPSSDIFTFDFMDADTGWAGGNGVYNTTDGGETWSNSTIWCSAHNLTFDRFAGGVFIAGDDPGRNAHISWDHGATWVPDGPYKDGCNFSSAAFWDDGVGVMPSDGHCTPWTRTTDGGHSWSLLLIDSPTSLPLCIPRAERAYCLTSWGSVLRTDNRWTSWRVLTTFNVKPPRFTTGMIVGNDDSLFVLLDEGAYLSSDSGISWTYLCGVPTPLFQNPYAGTPPWPRHFYKSGPRLYIPTLGADTVARLWLLDLDSLHSTGSATAEFLNGSAHAAIAPGEDVTVYYSNSTADSTVAADSAHFIIRYDASSLRLKNAAAEYGWYIVSQANPSAGSLEVWLTSNARLTSRPILSTTFTTILAGTSAKVYLESPVIYSHRKNCDCAVTSNPGSDSVQIDFTGCGGPTLWHFMQTGSIFELLSIEPNPASQSVTVALDIRAPGEVAISVSDVLGNTRLTATTTETRTSLPVSDLPSGTYFLRASEGGTVRTRRFVIDR